MAVAWRALFSSARAFRPCASRKRSTSPTLPCGLVRGFRD